MRKNVRGSFTIEAAFIVPLILLMFVVLLNILFYYHDKNILLGAAHETAVLGSGRKEMDAYALESHLFSGVQGRLLLFTDVDPDVYVEDEQIEVVCIAKKNSMSLNVKCEMSRTNPEDYIRNVRKIKKIQEGIGKEE